MAYNGRVATWVQNRTQVATCFFFVFHVQTPFKTESCLIMARKKKKKLELQLESKIGSKLQFKFNVLAIIKQLLAHWNLNFNFVAIIKQLSMPCNLSFNFLTIQINFQHQKLLNNGIQNAELHFKSRIKPKLQLNFFFNSKVEELLVLKVVQQWPKENPIYNLGPILNPNCNLVFYAIPKQLLALKVAQPWHRKKIVTWILFRTRVVTFFGGFGLLAMSPCYYKRHKLLGDGMN